MEEGLPYEGSDVEAFKAGNGQREGEGEGDGGTSALVPVEKQAHLVWQDLCVSVNNKENVSREILHNACGYAEPGQLLAIMGPSGCGKTTVLDALAGRLPKRATFSGEIYLNGSNQALTFGVAAYVPQEDVLYGTLTVRETLQFSAKLRLPTSMSRGEKAEVVAKLLLEMGLSEVADTFVGNWHLRGLSGGEKRRVSIAMELITQPALLFLDEPTSGLDSAAAYYVMGTIKLLAAAGRTIIVSIHQPSSDVFQLFDNLCLLSGGSTVYFGPAQDAVEFFSNAGFPCPVRRNPADHFLKAINSDFDFVKRKGFLSQLAQLQSHAPGDGTPGSFVDTLDDVETSDVVQRLLDEYEKSEMKEDMVQKMWDLRVHEGSTLPRFSPVSWPYQVVVLTHRFLLNNLRNIGVFWLRLAMYAMLCICIGTAYYNIGYSYQSISARAAVLFYIVAFLVFMSVAGFPSFAEDMRVFDRDRFNGYYGVVAFTISNWISSLPFLFLIALVSTLLVYFLIHLNLTVENFFVFLLLLFLSLVAVEGLMISLAAVLPNFLMGIAAGAGMMGIYMTVCGFFRLPFDLPKPVWRYPMHYIAFHTYAFQGFMLNEFNGLTFEGQTPDSPPISSQEALAFYDIPADLGPAVTKWVDMVILVGWILFYRLLFIVMVLIKDSRN